MKTCYTVSLSMLAGAALGATAIHGLHAQTKAQVYTVTEINVIDPENYAKEYAPKAQALIKAAGGRQVAIGGVGGAGAGKLTALDGEAPKRATLLVWDSMEKLQAWRANPEWKTLRQNAGKYATFRSYAIDGLPQ